MPSPAVERGQEVRQRLLTAAAELIPERGWTAVSTRVLAERAGLTPSVVHYHFRSVSAVLNEAVIQLMRRVLAETGDFLTTARTPAEAVDAMLASVAQYSGADPMSVLFVEAYLAANRDEELRGQLAQVVASFRDDLGDWLGDHDVAAPHQTAAVLAAAIDGILLHRGLGSGPPVEQLAPVLRRLVEANR